MAAAATMGREQQPEGRVEHAGSDGEARGVAGEGEEGMLSH